MIVNGYGFPTYRGGPMYYADRLGLKTVYEQLLELSNMHGENWRPARLLTTLARSKSSFSAWDNEHNSLEPSQATISASMAN